MTVKYNPNEYTKYTNGFLVIVDMIYTPKDDYIILENSKRKNKVYYNGLYRKDANPYFIHKNRRYHLKDFIQVTGF